MCGIAGKIYLGEIGRVSKRQIEEMTTTIAHRGPDDAGIYISSDRKVGLGHRRLAIIDLSLLGHQPMGYLSRYRIVFNGEIYNFQEQRRFLEKAGYKFYSQSDTEVIMALYDRYKEKCLDRMRGMFAFALYDEKDQVLFCARDRVGKKPFKYYFDGKTFLFASELKAILTQPEYKKKVDYLAIHHYLTLQYVPAPLTGFKEIRKLEPAHYLVLKLKTGELTTERYWRLDYSRKLVLTEEEWQERILAKLTESVKLRMIADVPLGAFLSGGIDSSAVVALMSQLSTSPVKTFSIGFNERRYSELPYAKIIAEKFNTDHTEFVVKPQAIEILPLLIRHYEEPYADSSALPTYYVSKLTREFVAVALNGDGGDENFAGYTRYSIQKFALIYERFLMLHHLLVLPISSLLNSLVKRSLFELADRFARSLDQDYRYRYVNYICYFSNQQKERLYTDEFRSRVWSMDSYLGIADKFQEANTPDRLDQTLYADFSTYLPDDLLVKVDIATMAVSLEGRSPFLDHELLELTAQIPSELKLKGRDQKKYILKKALRGLVPDEVMFRPKMGFGVPIGAWFRGDLSKYAEKILLSKRLENRGIFKSAVIADILREHQNTKVSSAKQIWALLTLELWFEEYFD